ncbi:hypothetical protein M9Y10_013010 [Tritrichomonas musculus]|uniref:Uncharacterized protein n=1 Tax=Tritrichomonas musculus TaxID=1915356 RepID=A0ABR2I6R3_9EUKA
MSFFTPNSSRSSSDLRYELFQTKMKEYSQTISYEKEALNYSFEKAMKKIQSPISEKIKKTPYIYVNKYTPPPTPNLPYIPFDKNLSPAKRFERRWLFRTGKLSANDIPPFKYEKIDLELSSSGSDNEEDKVHKETKQDDNDNKETKQEDADNKKTKQERDNDKKEDSNKNSNDDNKKDTKNDINNSHSSDDLKIEDLDGSNNDLIQIEEEEEENEEKESNSSIKDTNSSNDNVINDDEQINLPFENKEEEEEEIVDDMTFTQFDSTDLLNNQNEEEEEEIQDIYFDKKHETSEMKIDSNKILDFSSDDAEVDDE